MEDTQAGVRTRARAMAMAKETEDSSGAVKRRKVGIEKLRSPSSPLEQTKTLHCGIYVNSALDEDSSDSFNASPKLRSCGVPALCCSRTGSMEKPQVTDLEASFETEAAAEYKLNESESTPTTQFMMESGELKPCIEKRLSEMINSRRAVLSPEKMPPEAELEAFFAAAEEDMNERFKDKYNYDTVNDIPLKGRYNWVQVTPGK